ncbi:MAG: branched-chain amino acid ABC transporter permease [Actinomycetota bacterium]|nr:branched-chain amino acid ABC transporter permease [Actinomycetota bacterium]
MTGETRSRPARRVSGVDRFLSVIRVVMAALILIGFIAFVAQQIDPNNPFARWRNPDPNRLTGDQFKGLIISGLTQGSMYGLIALGYSMVYGVLGFINFAHGEVFMVGAMSGFITSDKLHATGWWESNFLLSLVIVVLVAIVTSTLTAVITERVAYRPLRNSPRLIPLITSIGVSFFIQNAVLGLLGPATKSYPRPPDWLGDSRTVPLGKYLVWIAGALLVASFIWCLWRRVPIEKDVAADGGKRPVGEQVKEDLARLAATVQISVTALWWVPVWVSLLLVGLLVPEKILTFDIKGTKIMVVAVAAASMVGLWYLVERTKTGRAMRAVSEDKEIAALMGINVNRIIVTTFAVGGTMAGIGGILWGLLFRSVNHVTGFLPGIKAFTAAVVGGIGNMGGAMAGGLALGSAESVAPMMLLEPLGVPGASQLKDAVAFTVLVLVLLFKPSGLFGERLSEEDRA